MRCARIWPSSASLRHKATTVSRCCLLSSPTVAIPPARGYACQPVCARRANRLVPGRDWRSREALLAQHRKNADSKRLETIPGIGALGASAIVATVPDASIFKKGRDFAAWIGIVSREDFDWRQAAARTISKQGDDTCGASWLSGRLRDQAGARHPEKYPG